MPGAGSGRANGCDALSSSENALSRGQRSRPLLAARGEQGGPKAAGLPAAEAAWVSDLSSDTRTLGLSPPWGARQVIEEKETLVTSKGRRGSASSPPTTQQR